MKIKEVETKTHLSSKTIRFYEDKGLIDIQRDHSGYRDYTDENVEELLRIKLYRQCGLSIQEIKDIQNGQLDLNNVLYDKISEYDKKDFELIREKNFCLEVIQAKGNYQELYEEMEMMDSNEYHELVDMIVDSNQQSLALQLFQTVILLGPMISFLYFYYENQTNRLLWTFVVSLFCTVCLTLSWKHFLKHYKFHKETISQGLKHAFCILLVLILGVILVVGVFMILTVLQQKLYFQDSVYFFTQSGWITSVTIICTALSISVFCLSQYAKYFHFHQYDDYLDVVKWVGKHMYLFLGVIVIMYYAFLTNTSTISTQQIVYHSFFHPQGIVYQYDDIERIECGFYKGNLFAGHDKGDFYYHVFIKDGRKISLDDNQVIPEYEDDTYSELVVFDNQVMNNKVQKISSDDYVDYSLYDQKYIDRFLSIINNK